MVFVARGQARPVHQGLHAGKIEGRRGSLRRAHLRGNRGPLAVRRARDDEATIRDMAQCTAARHAHLKDGENSKSTKAAARVRGIHSCASHDARSASMLTVARAAVLIYNPLESLL